MNRFVPNSQIYTSLKADLHFCWSDTEDVLLAAAPVEAHLTFLTQRITIPLTFIIEFIYESSPYKNNSIIRVHCCQLLGKPAIRLSQRERFTWTITKAATRASSPQQFRSSDWQKPPCGLPPHLSITRQGDWRRGGVNFIISLIPLGL